MAYASALGNLQAHFAVATISTFSQTTNDKARMEIALALARMVGNEHHFIQLLRASRHDLGTGVAQRLTAVKKKLDKAAKGEGKEFPMLDGCITDFARNQTHEELLH